MQPQMGNALIFTPTTPNPHTLLELRPSKNRVFSKQTNLTSEITEPRHDHRILSKANRISPLTQICIFENVKLRNKPNPKSEIYGRPLHLLTSLEWSPCLA